MGRLRRYQAEVSDTMWRWRCKIAPINEKMSNKNIGTDSSLDQDQEETERKEEVTTTGIDANVKVLYEGRNSAWSDDRFDWVDYPPKQISKAAHKAQDRPCLKVFKVNDRSKTAIGGRFPLKYHSIHVQNSSLIEALVPILRVESVHLDPNDIAVFTAPFRPLYFCQNAIVSLYRDTPAEVPLKAYFRILVNVLDDVFADLRRKTHQMANNRLANFSTMWTLFPSETTVYHHSGLIERVCKIKTSEYRTVKGAQLLVLSCEAIKFSGDDFVWDKMDLEIPVFGGNLPMDDLPAYPLHFCKDHEEIKTRLIARGQKVLDFQSISLCTYRGIGLCMSEYIQRHNVDGRVVIDFVGYNKYHLKLSKSPTSDEEGRIKSVLRGTKAVTSEDDEDDQPDDEDKIGHQANGFNYASDPSNPLHNKSKSKSKSKLKLKSTADEEQSSMTTYKRLSQQEQAQNKTDMLALGDQLMYFGPLVSGYSLKNKQWLLFLIDQIFPIVWNDTAFDHLVYDELQKDLVLSFVENHGRSPAPQSDVIMGKGQGLIMLLSGPPGTGKTLTAEAVADRSHRPLIYLQAEDLGISADTLGENIKRLFNMAIDWDAVVLLDEADVFMSERSADHIQRNELVSIFLREIEYFRGILLLTTNLYHAIDPAFRSRLSLQLVFNPLTVDARQLVWRKFLNCLPKSQIPPLPPPTTNAAVVEIDTASSSPPPPQQPSNAIVNGVIIPKTATTTAPNKVDDCPAGHEPPLLSDADLRQLALWQLNGREIQNAVKMTRAWCHQKGYSLSLLRLENGIKVTNPHAIKDGDLDESLYE